MKEYKVPVQSLIDHIKTAMDVDPWAKEMAEELLKEQTTRVLTLEEALGTIDPVYFESDGGMKCWVDGYISDDLKMAVLYRFGAQEFMIPLPMYGKSWRCWNKRPTDDQCKAVKWNGAE